MRHLREVRDHRAALNVLAQANHHRVMVIYRSRGLKHAAETHDLLDRVRDLHPDRGLTRDRGQDPHVRGLDRVGDVLAQGGDPLNLDRWAKLDLVAGDLRAPGEPGHLRVNLELLEDLGQRVGDDVPGGDDLARVRLRGWLEGGEAGQRVVVLIEGRLAGRAGALVLVRLLDRRRGRRGHLIGRWWRGGGTAGHGRLVRVRTGQHGTADDQQRHRQRGRAGYDPRRQQPRRPGRPRHQRMPHRLPAQAEVHDHDRPGSEQHTGRQYCMMRGGGIHPDRDQPQERADERAVKPPH